MKAVIFNLFIDNPQQKHQLAIAINKLIARDTICEGYVNLQGKTWWSCIHSMREAVSTHASKMNFDPFRHMQRVRSTLFITRIAGNYGIAQTE